MYNGIIHVNDYKLTAKQVTERDYYSETIPEIVALALEFITDWLSAQQLFEIKTSGSTGKPKVISISRRQMSLSAQNTIMALNIAAEDTALIAMNTKFIGGKMMIVRALESGMDMIILEPVQSHTSLAQTEEQWPGPASADGLARDLRQAGVP